ncbi:MAG: triose-phosphate isomerase [Patescibacteria group bacterium]
MKKLVIANWKMQLSLKESLELARKMVKKINGSSIEAVICPDYSALPFIGPILKSSKLSWGAQDSAPAEYGALTGEVSPLNLRALGVKYVILGHSERREHLHENSALIGLKIKAALNSKLVPVLCVGEKLTEKNNGETKEYLSGELRRALKGVKIKSAADLVVAYEPIWAISTNKNAKPIIPEEAAEILAFIKKQVAKILKKEVRILYGGSVNAINAGQFLQLKDNDGLLVGGASLQAEEFSKICQL